MHLLFSADLILGSLEHFLTDDKSTLWMWPVHEASKYKNDFDVIEMEDLKEENVWGNIIVALHPT